ncbi:M4 family metallopeptidase [Chitinimonas sp. JJ19]|uniref:M4 family metallopeptidase n=1 Tax=Chitinimonas sp. JJ19 TaxID=3109352 RepID=UPI003002C196
MTQNKRVGATRIALLALAVAGALHGEAATRIDLGQNVQRDGALASADLRATQHSMATADGGRKIKYQQYYQGVRVWGETAPVAHFAKQGNGLVSSTPTFSTGVVVDGIAADLPSAQPRMSKNDIQKLVRMLAARQGLMANRAELEQAELLVRLDEKSRAQLVYIASLHIPGDEPTSPTFMLDANTGAVLMSWDSLAHRDAHGPGGNEKVGKYMYGKDYKALDITQDCRFDSENVTTIDLKNGTASITAPYQMASCPATGTPVNDYRTINGAYSPVNDGHYFGNVIFNMYRDWYNTRPLTQKLKVRVHYGNGYENAFWNGDSMTFGDGATRFHPLVSLGVMAHEVSHGVTTQSSGLIYRGMSGGMNEAFSDIAAMVSEQYMYGKPTWLIGGEIVKGGADKALRYMAEPEKDGKSIGHASKFTDKLNVHYSSGVYNKAFYTLATTSGWDARKAFDIFLGANRLYWKANSTFNEGACGVIQAARDKAYNTADVIAAFDKVGVRCDGTTPPEPPTGGSPIALKSGTAVTGISLNAAGKQVYTIEVPANARFLAVRAGSGSGNANLYAKFGSEPSKSSSDAKSEGSANAEALVIPQPKAGRYYVLLDAPAAVAGASVIAIAR